MIFVRHRINSVAELAEIGQERGVEIDMRTHENQLVLAHNPFEGGENFEAWLGNYRHRILVVNVKEEGLEEAVESAIAKAKPDIEYLFLDQSFPVIASRLARGFKNSMVRVSDYESIRTLQDLAFSPEWVWVDTFNKAGLRKIDLSYLHEEHKLMLVSPELQGREFIEEAASMVSQFSDLGFLPDAICTKWPEAWETLIQSKVVRQ